MLLALVGLAFFFCFKKRTAYEMRISDWSSDLCSSDLADLQARGLNFSDYTFLKAAEERSGYQVRLWKTVRGSQLALYPNLNVNDPVWRALNRDARFRQALSLGINRAEINQVIYYGLCLEANNLVLPASPLYKPEIGRAHV